MKKNEKKPVLVDYELEFVSGELYKGTNFIRAFAVGIFDNKEKKPVKEILGFQLDSGFGANQQDATKDFIRRNKSVVLDAIFDIKK